MKHASILATALGLGTLALVSACGSETAAEEATPEAPAAAEETTTQTMVHYECASSCGVEKDASIADGIPQCCEAPMVPAE